MGVSQTRRGRLAIGKEVMRRRSSGGVCVKTPELRESVFMSNNQIC